MTDFTLMTAREIRDEVTANPELLADALRVLALRAMRPKPRTPSVDALAELIPGTTRYADIRSKGPERYKEWLAEVQAIAAPLAGVAKPKASAKAKSAAKPKASTKAKAAAKPKASAKPAAKPKASGGIDHAELAKAMGVEPEALGAMVKFFAALA